MSTWRNHRVSIFNGSYDSHKNSGKDYETMTLGEVFDMSPGCTEKAKAAAIIPSSYHASDARSHEVQRTKGAFVAVGLDIDKGNHDADTIDRLVAEFFGDGVARRIYSTSSASPENRKWRAIIPLAVPLSFEEWRLLSQAVHVFMAERGVICDPALARAGQLVFLPNVPPEKRCENGEPQFFVSEATDGLGASPGSGLAPAWMKRLQSDRERAEARAKAARLFSGTRLTAGGGSIDAFNRANALAEVLSSCGYEPSPYNDLDWRSPNQTSTSYATRIFVDDDGGEYWVSLSGSDAAAGLGAPAKDGLRFGDAFDLFVQYKHDGDKIAALREAQREAPPDASRYHLMTAAEISKLPPVRWLVRGILPAEGLAAIYGPPSTAKTFLALDLLAAVARGQAWFGSKTVPIPVTYVALEGEAGMSQRVQAYERRHGKLPLAVRFVARALNLLTPQDISDLASAIKAAGGGGGAICIDTLNRASAGADENDSRDMGRIIEAAKHLQREVGGLVLLVHHTGKDASKGLRGHSSLHAALDAAISITKEGDQFRWSIAKSKDGRDDKVSSFRLDKVVIGSDDDGEVITSCVIKPDEKYVPPAKPLSPPARQIVEAYQAVACRQPIGEGGRTSGVRTDDWRRAFYELSTADAPEAKKKAFSRARKDLQKRGDLTIDGDMNHLSLAGFSSLPIAGALQEAIAVVAKGDKGTGAGHVPDMSKGS
jgi:hypothetical protein